MESQDWYYMHERVGTGYIEPAIALLIFIAIAIITSIFVIPIYNKRIRIPRGRRPIIRAHRFFASIGLAFLITMAIIITLFKDFSSHKAPQRIIKWLIAENSYWTSRGFYDWWRMPLEYPYELVTTNPWTDADIREWRKTKIIVYRITRYYRDNGILIGVHRTVNLKRYADFLEESLSYTQSEYYRDQILREIDSVKALAVDHPDSLYFIFDCKDGSVRDFENVDDLEKAIHEFGYNEIPVMESVYKNWRIYRRAPQDNSSSIKTGAPGL